MYCIHCGKETVPGAKFCPHCGKEQVVQEKQETFEKIFDFGGALTYNDTVAKRINAWFSQNGNIKLTGVSISTIMNRNIPLKWQTVPNRLELRYTSSQRRYSYRFGYFCSMSIWGSNFQTVENKLEQWERDHPADQVIWTKLAGHQTNQGNTQACLKGLNIWTQRS